MKTEQQIIEDKSPDYIGNDNEPYFSEKSVKEIIEEITSDLATQLAKANSDKEKLGELLKLMSHSYNESGVVVKKSNKPCNIAE
jgi:hypothetical protein